MAQALQLNSYNMISDRIPDRGAPSILRRLLAPLRVSCGTYGLASFLALALCACATVPGLPIPIHTVARPHMQILGVKAIATERGLEVTGQVYYSTIDYGPLWGHLHVTAQRSNGRPPIEVDTGWGSLSPKGVGYAYFGALLRMADYHEVTGIRVEYRPPRYH